MTRKKLYSALILAGGKSSRMAFDKQTVKVSGKILPLYMADILSPYFSQIMISTQSPEYYVGCPYEILTDTYKNQGPLGGIYSGLTHCDHTHMYVIACDMPFINLNYIQYMKEQLEGKNALPQYIVTQFQKDMYEPFNGFYATSLKPEIRNRLERGENKISSLYKKASGILIPEAIAREFSPDWSMFHNINNPQALKDFISSTL